MQEGLIGIIFMEYPSDFVTSRSILRGIEYERLYFLPLFMVTRLLVVIQAKK
ncbi:hypothetical protein JCM39068_34230 [Desulfocastanea catecholica]